MFIRRPSRLSAPSARCGIRPVLILAACLPGLSVCLPHSAVAQASPEVLNGVPQQIVPEASEVGLGGFSDATGTVTIVGSGNTGTGGTSGGGGTGVAEGDNSALDEMQGTSWGIQAAQYATQLGVDPSAVAATCMLETQCGNNSLGTRGDVFQMSQATYNQEIARALAANPGLAGSIVAGPGGRLDAATDSIAAAQYLKDGASYLENNGVTDPTNLAVRGYYNFGPADGASLAKALDTASITDVLNHLSPSNYAGNGIVPGETVGQWRAATSARMGGTANSAVLL